ncbi:glycosyltransferase family 4 protein [Amycolatopsis pithecellobii]|uniref:Glycosyltransferase n=1 Tax=Amycolatopsis pithecellobii TaxID=664692 RepID=A0A6N7YSS7_9PSEU|nr:glycosyltransferase family 1 protein [Amycolatopsis pithecellobii]MTD55002.1 glycosyltransferase [Amycolatopsis pithecellobii]
MPELVVIAEQLLAPVPGGTGRYTAELLRALAVTAPPGWEVAGVVARRSDVPVDGVRVLALPPRALVAAWQLGVPYWPGGDAVHAPTPLAPPRGRVSVTVHDTVPWTHPGTLTPRGVAWHRAMIRRAARRARGLIVPTQAVADDLRRWVPVRVPVRVAGHGVTAALSSGVDVADLPEHYVLAVGTLEPRKGIDVLLDAMAELEVPLVLAGQPGWGGVAPRGDRVRVLGRVSDDVLATVLRRASVLAAPSLAEGFGLPVLEAMAAGVPVVHSDAPALVEVAGGAGVCVPRGDAKALAAGLREVLSAPAKAAELVAAGRARAARFSWERAAEAVWGVHQGAGS